MAWCLRHLLLFIMFSEIARLADYGHVVALQLGGDIAEVKVGIIKGADVVLAQHFEQVGADGKLGKFPDNALAVEEEGYLDRRGKAAVGCELSPRSNDGEDSRAPLQRFFHVCAVCPKGK